MKKNSTPATLLLAALISTLIPLAYADDVQSQTAPAHDPAASAQVVAAQAQTPLNGIKVQLSACSQWKPTQGVDKNYLAKLEKNVAQEKPKEGILYSQDKLVVLLATDLAAAKAALQHKDKLEQKDGRIDLRGVNLKGFNLSGMNFDNVDFKGAEMDSANLSGASFRGANLYKTEFEGANLNYADLSFADASKANFRLASLCEASLESSDVEDANFVWAYMKNAKLDRATHVPDNIYSNADNLLRIGLAVPPLK